MKIIEAINQIDALKHNTYSQNDKVRWLSRLDWTIKRTVIDTHEGAEAVEYNGYNDLTDLYTEMLVPAPYDEMYLLWLEAQIDYHNGEYGKYNNSVTKFSAALMDFKDYYNRTHMPIGKSFKYF